MSSVANVAIHPSQFPQAVQRDLLESLRTRRVNHKFHYDSVKQTQKWLALHQLYSPSRNDTDCAAIYDAAFASVGELNPGKEIHLLGLGCGGGQKDTRLLSRLQSRRAAVSYTPCDVSTAMVLVAREAALSVIPDEKCLPFVCDLATSNDLPEVFLTHHTQPTTRFITFFGMIPNFEPDEIMPKLAALVRPSDWLLFSANLAPGPDYTAGVQKVLPQYDNALTREWLLTFLLDLGVERSDGEVRFSIEAELDRKRIVARFHFVQGRTVEVGGESVLFQAGESIRLFFSYRYTLNQVRALLAMEGLVVRAHWETHSGEEGIFCCSRS